MGWDQEESRDKRECDTGSQLPSELDFESLRDDCFALRLLHFYASRDIDYIGLPAQYQR